MNQLSTTCWAMRSSSAARAAAHPGHGQAPLFPRDDEIHRLDPGSSTGAFEIADNGIGFDPSVADKIFTIFQRLNTRDKYEGTGIGLALCRKIVTAHEGMIYASSEKNAGAVFHLFLPVRSSS